MPGHAAVGSLGCKAVGGTFVVSLRAPGHVDEWPGARDPVAAAHDLFDVDPNGNITIGRRWSPEQDTHQSRYWLAKLAYWDGSQWRYEHGEWLRTTQLVGGWEQWNGFAWVPLEPGGTDVTGPPDAPVQVFAQLARGTYWIGQELYWEPFGTAFPGYHHGEWTERVTCG